MSLGLAPCLRCKDIIDLDIEACVTDSVIDPFTDMEYMEPILCEDCYQALGSRVPDGRCWNYHSGIGRW